MTVKITLEMLEEKDACEGQIKRFKEHFPDGFVFENKDDAIKKCIHAAENFDVMWMADELLGEDARAEYEKMLAPTRAECNKAIVFAWAEHKKEKASTLAELDKAMAIAFAKTYWVQETTFFRCGCCGHPLDKEHKALDLDALKSLPGGWDDLDCQLEHGTGCCGEAEWQLGY